MLDVGDMTGILMKIVLLNVPTPPPPEIQALNGCVLELQTLTTPYHSNIR